MAKKKAELEADCAAHQAVMEQVRQAHKDGDFLRAVDLAVLAWDYVDGMMQYERRHNNAEFKSIESIEFVLRNAPLLFDFEHLETLAVLLKSQRRIDKNTATNLAEKLDHARLLMWDAHRLWRYLEHNSQVRQGELRINLGGDQDRWRNIAERWEEMGLIQRAPHGGSYLLALSTKLNDKVRGKCPSCGATGSGVKFRLLDKIGCPKCERLVHFVFVLSPSH